eukprot:scaffold1938_cov399-Prasinococcus_capsulatus_cf.AAC.4
MQVGSRTTARVQRETKSVSSLKLFPIPDCSTRHDRIPLMLSTLWRLCAGEALLSVLYEIELEWSPKCVEWQGYDDRLIALLVRSVKSMVYAMDIVNEIFATQMIDQQRFCVALASELAHSYPTVFVGSFTSDGTRGISTQPLLKQFAYHVIGHLKSAIAAAGASTPLAQTSMAAIARLASAFPDLVPDAIESVQAYVDMCRGVGEGQRAQEIVDEVLDGLLRALPSLVQLCEGTPGDSAGCSLHLEALPHAASLVAASSNPSGGVYSDSALAQEDRRAAAVRECEIVHAVELAQSMQSWSALCEHSTADVTLSLSS